MLWNSNSIQINLFDMTLFRSQSIAQHGEITWHCKSFINLLIWTIIKSNQNCAAWWNSVGRLPKGKCWQFHHVVQFWNPTKIVQHGEIQLEDYQKENVDNFTMLCNSETQPKLYSMVKFIWKTTKRKTLAISPCWTGLNWFKVGWNPFQSMVKYS